MEEIKMEGLLIILVYTLLIGGLNIIKGKSNNSYIMLFTLALGLVVNMSLSKVVANEIISGAIFMILHQICLNVFDRVRMICF